MYQDHTVTINEVSHAIMQKFTEASRYIQESVDRLHAVLDTSREIEEQLAELGERVHDGIYCEIIALVRQGMQKFGNHQQEEALACLEKAKSLLAKERLAA